MICYRDMTFCSYYKECVNGDECGRALDESVVVGAKAIGLFIMQFSSNPECYVEKDCDETTDIR